MGLQPGLEASRWWVVTAPLGLEQPRSAESCSPPGTVNLLSPLVKLPLIEALRMESGDIFCQIGFA